MVSSNTISFCILRSFLIFFYLSNNMTNRKHRKTTLKDFLENTLNDDELKLINRSFEIVGDIAIMEIPEKLEKHETEIGEALLKVNTHIKVILKKFGIHKGEFRTQDLVHIAGENRKDTEYKESGIRLKINPETVYFSARLSTEREKLMEKLEEDKRVLVMFSGAGPYTFVALKKQPNLKCITSIEINPQGHNYALQSKELNKNLLKKSELFNNIVNFLRSNKLPISEKRIIQILNKIKIHFINGDVREKINELTLKEYNEDVFAWDNYLFQNDIKKSFENFKLLEKNQICLDLNTIPDKKAIMPVILLFCEDISFICRIADKNYIFDTDMLKGYLINYLDGTYMLDKINLYDEIYMPLPKDAEHFLDCAFKIADENCIVHMYDFIKAEDFPILTEQKIIESAAKFNRKVKIIETRKVGQYSPRKYRTCCDFKILN